MQDRALLERAGDRAGDRHLEPVEDPADAERDDDQRMEPRPRQPVEPGRNVGLDEYGDIMHNRTTPGRPTPPSPASARHAHIFRLRNERGASFETRPSRGAPQAAGFLFVKSKAYLILRRREPRSRRTHGGWMTGTARRQVGSRINCGYCGLA